MPRYTTMAGALFLFLVACDGDPPAVDAGAPTPDAGEAPSCDLAPTPIVAGTAETDALADAPARCDQAPHAWLRDADLGEVTQVGAPTRFPRVVLEGLAESQGVTLPRAIESGVATRVITYRTQDRGAAIETTALVAYPEDLEGEDVELLLFAHGTSGFKHGCGPTADSASQLLAAVFASFGFVVVAPDYLGLEIGDVDYGALHPYLVGQATAIASIDAARAALRMDPDDRGGVCLPPRYVLVGGSQGGHAALWVDRLAPYYARELELLGVVATVPPADLFGQVERALLELVNASANSVALFGTAPYWYGHGDRLDEVFASPYDVDVPAALEAECTPNALDGVTSLDEVFAADLLAAASGGTLAEYGPWGCLLEENGLTTTSVARIGEDATSYGIFFVTGSEDPLVHTPIERVAFEALCDAGMPLTYMECEGADHGDATLWALPELLRFVDARVAGEAFERPASCVPPAAVRCEGTPDDA